MANITGASLEPIYRRLSDAPQYHPLEADTFADWSLEAGDIVTITRDGQAYQSPVHTSRVNWRKKQMVSLASTGNEKREAISKISQRKFNRGSGGIRSNEYQHIFVEDSYKQMTAGLELSTSHVSLYVDNKYTQMSAGLNLTSSSAALYVDNKYSQMRAGLNLTSSSAALYVDNKYSQMRAGLNLTSSSAALYVDNKYSQMRAGLDLTSSSAALYVDNKYSQMRAGLDLTSSSAALYVDNKYSQMRSGLEMTSSSAALYVDNKYSQMKAGLDITSSSAALYVDNKYSQMKAGLDLTSSSASLYVDNKYNQMKAGLDLTSSSASLYVDNKYNQMKAGLDLTSSSASLYVDNKYNQLKSGLDLTSSSAALYVDNKYNQMKSGLNLTSSSASLYVDSKYDQMKSGLDLTSSSAALYVDSKYNQMKAGLDITMSSSTLYAQSRTTRAAIVTRINANGEGEALIAADKVSITGATTINGTFRIGEDGFLYAKKTIFAEGNITCSTAGSNIAASHFSTMGSDGYLRLWGQGTTNYDLTASALGGMIKTVSVSGTTLTLTQWDGTVVNFNKAATTPTLSGSWGSGVLTVTSNPSPVEDYKTILQHGTDTWDSNNKGVTAQLDAYKYNGPSQPELIATNVTRIWVDATTAYNAGRNSYTHSAQLYCSSVRTDTQRHVTLTVTYSLSQTCPFTEGESYNVHW